MIGTEVDRSQQQSAAMALSRLAGRVRDKYGIPIQDPRHMSDGIMRQIEAVIRQLAKDAFREGYHRGCRAGVEAAAPGIWAAVRVPRQRVVWNIPFVGSGEFEMCTQVIPPKE